MEPKPKFFAPEYAQQFEDSSVAAVYRKRPPYPPETFEIIASLFPAENRHLLDLGAGTGEVSIPMANVADSVHAVEPSAAMVAIGHDIPGSENVTWYNTSGEEFDYPKEYGLIVCAQCLGWMDWKLVFPKMVSALHTDGYLVIVSLNTSFDPAWQHDLVEIIMKYSTNQDVVPFDLIGGIVDRGLFEETSSHDTAPMAFQQSVDNYIDSIHARNGFSRDRMTPSASTSFDREVRDLLGDHVADGVIKGEITARVVWGNPKDPFDR